MVWSIVVFFIRNVALALRLKHRSGLCRLSVFHKSLHRMTATNSLRHQNMSPKDSCLSSSPAVTDELHYDMLAMSAIRGPGICPPLLGDDVCMKYNHLSMSPIKCFNDNRLTNCIFIGTHRNHFRQDTTLRLQHPQSLRQPHQTG